MTMSKKQTTHQQPEQRSANGWLYRWNDTVLTEQEYNQLVKEHKEWVLQQTSGDQVIESNKRSRRNK